MPESRNYVTMRSTLVRTRPSWGGEQPDEALVRSRISLVSEAISVPLSDSEQERLVREMLEEWNVSTEEGVALVDTAFVPWLDEERKQSITWHRGDAYREYLLDEGRSLRSIENTDDDSFNILGLMGDPGSGDPFDRRGLILGDVQSGKTSSYLSLIGKAADAGYRLIVVLAGQTDRLRQQTQERVDEGFIGRKAAIALQPGGRVGIGRKENLPTVQSLTTAHSDFSVAQLRGQNIALDDGSSIFTVVLKKNKSVLETFGKWLSDQDSRVVREIPLLVLDDESDYASVNTSNRKKPELDPTAINNAIRNLLNTSSKKSYVAYTATPFANVFIDHSVPDDLFPRDFIYAIEAPSNYVGVTKVFGDSDKAWPIGVHEISDAEEIFPFKHKKELIVEALPESLIEALQTFALHNSIRDLRGSVNKPRSMLINVSRFTNVHEQTQALVHHHWSEIKFGIDAHAKRPDWIQSPTMSALHDIFAKRFDTCEFTWDQVRSQLPAAVASVRIRTYNSAPNNQSRDTEASERTIAIGGAVLSRGVTLNGLGVSYFYQSPRASDTLLQMGRWFGYRDGYEDLCHLWIDSEVARDFRRAYDAIQELRDDLRRMKNEGLTPRDFGLAVRHHPEALMITARNKMQAADLARRPMWAFAQVLETVKLDAAAEVLDQNLTRTQHLVQDLDALGAPRQQASTFLRWNAVPHEVIADYLGDYRGSAQERPALDPTSLAGFTRRLGAQKFPTWDVVFSGQWHNKVLTWGQVTIPTRRRTCEYRHDTDTLLVSGSRARLAGSSDVAGLLVDPSASDPTFARKRLEAAWRSRVDADASRAVPETAYYEGFVRPVLMIYMLTPEGPEGEALPPAVAQRDAVAALKFIFPGTPYPKKGRPEEMFYLNSVAAAQYENQNYAYDSDFDEDEE